MLSILRSKLITPNHINSHSFMESIIRVPFLFDASKQKKEIGYFSYVVPQEINLCIWQIN